jgi:Hint domain
MTKAHVVYVDGVLIPAKFLVNHRTIVWDDHVLEVTIYHIELETHDVLVANGAPAETYRDDGNRWLFRNARRLHGLVASSFLEPDNLLVAGARNRRSHHSTVRIRKLPSRGGNAGSNPARPVDGLLHAIGRVRDQRGAVTARNGIVLQAS